MDTQPKGRHRGFCFTLNNWVEADWETFLSLETVTRPKITYAICGKEVGENGTPHLQGYVKFANANEGNWNRMRKWFPRARLAVARGDDFQNQKYCSEDGNFYEFGTPKGRGERSDLKKVHKAVIDGEIKNERGFFENEEVSVSYQSLQLARNCLKLYGPKRKLTKPPTVHWFFGESGSGKSLSAMRCIEQEDRPYYKCSSNGKWWDGYDGEKVVLIDDWRPDWCKYQDFLQILDLYEYKVEFKGGMRELEADTFYVTSPLDPVRCWKNEDPKQLIRRITDLRRYIGEVEFRKNQTGEEEPEEWDPLDPTYELIDPMTHYNNTYTHNTDEHTIY